MNPPQMAQRLALARAASRSSTIITPSFSSINLLCTRSSTTVSSLTLGTKTATTSPTATTAATTPTVPYLTYRRPISSTSLNSRGIVLHQIANIRKKNTINANNHPSKLTSKASFTTETNPETDLSSSPADGDYSHLDEFKNPYVDHMKERACYNEDGEEILPPMPLPPFDDGSGKVMADPELHALAEEIIHMSLYDVHQLTKLAGDFFGIEDDMSFAGGGGGVGGGDGEAPAQEEVAEEKTIFDLKLTGFDAKSKIKIIKEVRAITALGLKEAKEMVEGVPKVLKKGIKKEEAEELKEKLEAVGATVEID